jgi:uncharacterized protein YcbX
MRSLWGTEPNMSKELGTIATVDSLWRYPVKSMRGEELNKAFVGFSGIYGDRYFAFKCTTRPRGCPYLTASCQSMLLQFRPRFRYPSQAARPINLAEAEALAPGLTPVFADPADMIVDVETPTGQILAIDDPALLGMLLAGVPGEPVLSLARSDRALTDCRPVSMISCQCIRRLGEEMGAPLDPRRFRANIYLNFQEANRLLDNDLIGRSLRIGPKAVVSVLERDPRCAVINLHPESGESTPAILRHVARAHGGDAGVYAAVLVEGMIHKGDTVEFLDERPHEIIPRRAF